MIAKSTVLNDELLRSLMAAGQVDVLVGLPTFNNSSTVVEIVRAVHVAFARHFPRERTLLINCDGGSTDGTAELVRSASLGDAEHIVATQALRTAHRISTAYAGQPARSFALRTLFTAAELLRARAIAVISPNVMTVAPEWIRSLVSPVLRDRIDFVAPVYARGQFDGLLVSQLVRPLLRATYGVRIHEPLGSEFACSRELANHYLQKSAAWESDLIRDVPELWIATSAFSGGFRCAEVALGEHVLERESSANSVPEILQQIVGSLFACLTLHQDFWLGKKGSVHLPFFGRKLNSTGYGALPDLPYLENTFRHGVRELSQLLEQVLAPESLKQVRQRAESANVRNLIPDDLWAVVVFDYLLADHRHVMSRTHLAQALVPLYLGRAATFVAEQMAKREVASASDDPDPLESLCLSFEKTKETFVDRWQTGRVR